MFLSGALILSFSRRQASIALSSCEAELYSLMSSALETMAIRAWLEEQRVPLSSPPTISTDSTSAMQLTGRRGPGRLKHIDSRVIALQTWVGQHRFSVAYVATADNRADVLTKLVPYDTMEKHCVRCGLSPFEKLGPAPGS